jgi:integrase/recombinase XerD
VSPRRREPVIVGDPADPFGFPALTAEFTDWMGAHGYSPRTVENRQRMLAHLVTWLDERGVTRPGEVTRPMLERYQRWLFHYRKANGDPLTFRSQSQRLLPVRAFFKWAARQHHLVHNPASELELPKVERRLPKPALTISEAETVLAQPDLTTAAGVRDRAILETLYSTGIRRAELAGLAVFDIDQERRTLLVRQGKGRKDRLIPIGERALAWIDRYLTEVRSQWAREPDDGTLFLTANGTGFSLDRLTQLARGYVQASGVGKQGACHLFRHTLATLMLEGGADLRYVQQMLGHADISTTQIYTHVSIRHLQAIHAATHPAATNTPRTDRHVHPVHQPVDGEGQTLSAAALLAAIDQDDDEENRPATGSPADNNSDRGGDGDGRDDGVPYRRTIIR